MDTLTQQIENFTTQNLEQLRKGEVVLLLQNDEEIIIAEPQDTAVLYNAGETGDNSLTTPEEMKHHLINNLDALLAQFYTKNSWGLRHFNIKISNIADERGLENFIKTPSKPHTLVFVCEKGVIEAIDNTDYRFKYGLYLELSGDFDSMILHNQFSNWLQSKTAYQDYLSVYFSTFL